MRTVLVQKGSKPKQQKQPMLFPLGKGLPTVMFHDVSPKQLFYQTSYARLDFSYNAP